MTLHCGNLPDVHVFFCSLSCDLVTGRPLALKLGLSRRKKHVQLRTRNGQLQLSKVLPHKNLAKSLTKNLSTASFHRLLPKLIVHTRAVEAQALFTRLSQEQLASFSSSSFFIGMVALQPQMALTKASSTDLSLQLPSLTEWEKEPEKTLAFPELATEQLQKRIASSKSLQCQKLTQISFDSLTRYSLSKQSCKKNFQSLSAQLCRYSFQSFSQQLCRIILQSFSEQLCKTQSLSDQLCKTSLESLSAQLCRNNSESLSDQLCRSSLDSLIRQNSSKQLQPISFDQSSFEQRAFNCAALLGSTTLGHKQLQQSTIQSFQLTSVQLCQCMAKRGASNTASHNRALTTNLQRRSRCTRYSQQALTTSTSKSTTSSWPRSLLAIFLFSFLFNNIFVSNIFLNNSFWKQEIDKNNELSKTAWAQELDKHLADKPFQQQQLQQQLPEHIQEKKYKKEKLELQEQTLELSGRSAYSQQFETLTATYSATKLCHQSFGKRKLECILPTKQLATSSFHITISTASS